MKIAFVTDSGIGKTAAEMAADDIISLPLQISVDGRSLQDMEDIDKDQLITLLQQQKAMATSLPALGRIQECFEKLKAEGYELIFAVPICSGLSGTISAMQTTAAQLAKRHAAFETRRTLDAAGRNFSRIIKDQADSGD